MSDWRDLAEQFRHHFAHREHLYGVLLAELADDLEAGGPTAEICADFVDATREEVIQLRLLAGIFRLVLTGAAPELEPFYPCLGGTADPARVWPVVRPVLAKHRGELRAALELAPQTNEVGRSACLAVGAFEAVRRSGLHRVRLIELGASAGLNLNLDRYRFIGSGWSWGATRSGLVIDAAAGGVQPEPFTIVQRRGCDIAPVDVVTEEGATYLRSFVWPFDLDRHRRLMAAIEITRRHPPIVDRASALAWLAAQLDRPSEKDVLTIVWHSITEQYWPHAEREAVAAIIDGARTRMPLARISMEGVPPSQLPGSYDVSAHGPRTRLDGVTIARSHHHGPPVVLVQR